MEKNEIKKPVLYGLTATIVLLTIYFTVLTFVSGWSFALSQFSSFWYFIITLSSGFGIQVGLYTYLRNAIKTQSRKALVASGTTSTAAMISCCSHYLVNLLPILGITGIITLAAQYQIQIFWIGIVFNVLGILYMLKNLRRLILI